MGLERMLLHVESTPGLWLVLPRPDAPALGRNVTVRRARAGTDTAIYANLIADD